jgi:hypothetical protein
MQSYQDSNSPLLLSVSSCTHHFETSCVALGLSESNTWRKSLATCADRPTHGFLLSLCLLNTCLLGIISKACHWRRSPTGLSLIWQSHQWPVRSLVKEVVGMCSSFKAAGWKVNCLSLARVHKLKTVLLQVPLRAAIYENLGPGPQRRDSLDEY